MPLTIFRNLELGELQKFEIALQMAYVTLKKASEMIEDVLLKIDNFIFPVDFVVLDM